MNSTEKKCQLKKKKFHLIFTFSGDLPYVPIWEHMPISGMVHPRKKNFFVLSS